VVPRFGSFVTPGGGGKGAALPGAVAALQESGVLKNAKVLNGASVGSMTAALVAAGISAEDFAKMGNDPRAGEAISEGRGGPGLLVKGALLGMPLSGQGLEVMMRQKIGESVVKQIKNFRKTQALDEETAKTLETLETKATLCQIGLAGGVTFGDLRTLSKIIPDIKELNISGTYMADNSSGRMEKNGKPQLAMFTAGTTPELDIAKAVHASAALPPVFAPVEIPLPSGVTARFEDGGVMNNAPTSDLVGAQRSLDPMPTAGKITFVFEGEDDVIQQGPNAVPPTRKRVNDFFSGAPDSAAEYAKKRALAERPDEVVRVPLKFRMPAANGGQGALKDFSTLTGGTLNMNMPVEDKLILQKQTNAATKDYLAERDKPKTTTFGSVSQMLSSVSDADLAVMAKAGFADAQAEMAFRSDVTDAIDALDTLVEEGVKAADFQGDSELRWVFDALSQYANGNQDRVAYVARELNRSCRFDPLMKLAESHGDQRLDVVQAGVAVQVGLNVQSRAKEVSRELLHPKMMTTEMTVADGGELLRRVDDVLRTATTEEKFDEAIGALIAFFEKKSDILGLSGHKKFVAELKKYKFAPPPPPEQSVQPAQQASAVPPPPPRRSCLFASRP